jgi:hypothetical protein
VMGFPLQSVAELNEAWASAVSHVALSKLVVPLETSMVHPLATPVRSTLISATTRPCRCPLKASIGY